MTDKGINFLLAEDQAEKLDIYAKNRGKNRSEILRELVYGLKIGIDHVCDRIPPDKIWEWLNDRISFRKIVEMTMTDPEEEVSLMEYCKEVIDQHTLYDLKKAKEEYLEKENRRNELIRLLKF